MLGVVVCWRFARDVDDATVSRCPHCKKVLGIGVRKAAWIN